MILAGRRINDGMAAHVAGRMVKAMLRRGIAVAGSRVLVLGLTFKENCPDLRNTRVVDLVQELRDFGARVEVHDPCADPEAARAEYGLELVRRPEPGTYDGLILAVAHDAFRNIPATGFRRLGRPVHVLFDLKAVLPAGAADLRL